MTIIKLNFTAKDPREVEKFLELTENKLFINDEDFIDSFGEVEFYDKINDKFNKIKYYSYFILIHPLKTGPVTEINLYGI